MIWLTDGLADSGIYRAGPHSLGRFGLTGQIPQMALLGRGTRPISIGGLPLLTFPSKLFIIESARANRPLDAIGGPAIGSLRATSRL
jgi:hypothetical protein